MKFFRLKKLFAWIFRVSQDAVDIGIKDGYDEHIYGKSYILTITLSRPLFIRRRNCDHAHAKKNGYIRNGETWCLGCERLISVGIIDEFLKYEQAVRNNLPN
jgi:hypothetical protein